MRNLRRIQIVIGFGSYVIGWHPDIRVPISPIFQREQCGYSNQSVALIVYIVLRA
jgi:hypothetical protein